MAAFEKLLRFFRLRFSVAAVSSQAEDCCGACGPAVQNNIQTGRTTEFPIMACTLTPGDAKQRAAKIRALTARSLRHIERQPLAIELTYASEAATEIRDLVAAERICCAFLTFELQENEQRVRLTITAPESAGEPSNMLFAMFAPEHTHPADAHIPS